ncbi:protein of unknown function (plasmid) [Cupriavidus taiwanensis]|uniref:Uncharacterized protein n=1 Tax=Cupriavidus taiwanensis TaxID=164546 RepID=A0A375HC28_9BURK|nr:protein of unknown function [Cupriavidus taiwanensis]SOZ72455.1 protein of unknown function [Cupriavidus taiwanensis]SOZ74859.1 protein of unknown function [Cupriavidus taiwanensis]SPA11552.1 protein of unknown function [Cupriavidus taiwanensis]SPD49292.1 protein of unknown function [Cupriavidus taiwanensis]
MQIGLAKFGGPTLGLFGLLSSSIVNLFGFPCTSWLGFCQARVPPQIRSSVLQQILEHCTNTNAPPNVGRLWFHVCPAPPDKVTIVDFSTHRMTFTAMSFRGPPVLSCAYSSIRRYASPLHGRRRSRKRSTLFGASLWLSGEI